MLPRVLLSPALLGCAVLLAACSGSSTDAPGAGGTDPASSESVAPFDVEVVRGELVDRLGGDSAEGRADAECFADGLLADVDPGELVEDKVVVDGHLADPIPPLGEDFAQAWVEVQMGCTDFIASSTEALAAQSKGAIDRDTYAACLTAKLSEDDIRAGLVAAAMGDIDSPALVTVSDAQTACVTEATAG